MNNFITIMRKLNPQAAYPARMEEAIVGIVRSKKPPVFRVSRNKIIKIHMAEGMSREDAIEFCEYNLERSLPYYGENAPIMCGSYYR